MDILKDLIHIKSESGSEQEIQNYILDFLTSRGLKPVLVKGNVSLLIEGDKSDKCLIFNAHVDTVSYGSIPLWNKNPYSGYEFDGKIYGLGASDNKASVATLLLLAKELSVKKPDCNVIFMFTVGEEVDGHGTNDIVKWLSSKHLKQYKSMSAIVCEPTSLATAGLAHKGNLFLKITTVGKSGHGSVPINLKDHAVIKMYKVVESLQKLNTIWSNKYKNKILGSPTIGIATSISAGNLATPNKFPDMCTATFDVRTVPAMHQVALSQIKKVVAKLGKVEYLFPPVGCAYTDPHSDIAKIFKNVVKVNLVAFSGSSDMPFFTQKGIPTVIFGPGEASQMHKPNEYCYAYKVEKCVTIFKKVIQEFARI